MALMKSLLESVVRGLRGKFRASLRFHTNTSSILRSLGKATCVQKVFILWSYHTKQNLIIVTWINMFTFSIT